MTHGFNNNGSDDHNDDDMPPIQAEFLKEDFEPGSYAVLTILIKTEQLDKFITMMYESGLDIGVTPSAKNALEKETDLPMMGNSPGSNHGNH